MRYIKGEGVRKWPVFIGVFAFGKDVEVKKLVCLVGGALIAIATPLDHLSSTDI